MYVKELLKLCDDIEMFINIITDVAKRNKRNKLVSSSIILEYG